MQRKSRSKIYRFRPRGGFAFISLQQPDWRCTNTLDVAMASDRRGMDFSTEDHYRKYRGSQVNIRFHLVFPISPLLLLGFWTNLVPMEGHSLGESNAICYEKFGAELAKNVG